MTRELLQDLCSGWPNQCPSVPILVPGRERLGQAQQMELLWYACYKAFGAVADTNLKHIEATSARQAQPGPTTAVPQANPPSGPLPHLTTISHKKKDMTRKHTTWILCTSPPTNPWEMETQRNEVILDFVQNLFSVLTVVTPEAIIVPDPTHSDR